MSVLLRWLLTLLRLFWEWLREALPALRELLQDFRARRERGRRDRQRPEREQRRTRSRCVPLNEPGYKRPDPLIYSQTYLRKLGLAVTWDNPDIQLYQGGTAVPSSQLLPDTNYEIEARIWNNSTEAPVVDLPVRFSFRSFGVGAQNHAIGHTQVTLGVKGGANHPAFAKIPWRTPSAPGHYCIQVLLDWADDANPLNNLGQENTNVGQPASPVEFTFTLGNPTRETLRYRFEVDTYQIAEQQPCPEDDEVPERPAQEPENGVPPEHDPRNHALPSGWQIAFAPPNPELAPGDEQLIQVTATAPDGFVGRQPINVNAFHRYGLAGGMTFYVERQGGAP